MAEIDWISRTYEYGSTKCPQLEEVLDHPLKPLIISVVDGRSVVRRGTLRSTSTSSSTRTPTPTQSSTSSLKTFADPLLGHSNLDGTDPLTQFAREELDPLSKMATDEWDYSSNVATGKKIKDKTEELVEPWASRRNTILNKFTTNEKLSIITSFLSGGERVVVKVQSSGTVDRVKTRLERLDEFEEGSVRQLLDLSQQEYMARIEQLNNELVQAWHSDFRVKALKIAIQCAKLLGDTSVIAFYPSKFVLITDILDIFGKLVYERLKMKSEFNKPGSKSASLPENFTPDMVPENAKETCQNWFYKIASIRELVPRLFVEMAIIKSYNFLTMSEAVAALKRMTRMIRGIGNPLIAIYARCYLCRVGLALNKNTDFEFAKENFYDFLCTFQQLFTPSMKIELIKQNISFHSYLNLYTPALEWILEIVAATATDNLMTEIISRCKLMPKRGLLINTALTSFKASYIAERSMEFVNLVTTCEDDGFPQYLLYRNLGESFLKEPPSKDDCQMVLNAVWKYLAGVKDSTKFMYCTEIWIQFTVIHFSVTELNQFLGAIINHLGSNRIFEQFYPQLQTIVEKIVAHTQDFESLLIMNNFLPLLDLFHKESIKVDVCKIIVDGFGAQNGPITDPIVINALMFIMKIIHDSVSALTVEDEKRQIGNLICGLVQRIDFGRDFEKQLNFYVEARAAFPNLDAVHVQLVQCVNRLAVDTRKIVRGHHTRRTSAFVRACAAFCFITIPSLSSVHSRLQLYLLSGQVSLLNQCLGQADASFKAALSLVPEMPKTIDVDGRQKSTEPCLLSYLSNFLSTLLVVPDSPEHGVLYLMRGLLNAIQRCFEEHSLTKYYLYLRVLDLLSTYTQENYPYHVDKVDSNDRLYGSDQKFIVEVNKLSSKVLHEILTHLKYLGTIEQLEKQSSLALDLFIRMMIRADLQQSTMAQLAVNLWNLSQKHGDEDQNRKIRQRIVEHMMLKSRSSEFEHFTEILRKLMKT